MLWNEHPDQLIQTRKSDKTPLNFVIYAILMGTPLAGVETKIRGEELKRIEDERTAEKKVTFTQGFK